MSKAPECPAQAMQEFANAAGQRAHFGRFAPGQAARLALQGAERACVDDMCTAFGVRGAASLRPSGARFV
eukprot:CAMPEP_0176215282 /NCGR_PEP_ID=MMETSP0121_2-20121125/16600_1 /TAXON_ID=160619 /ORGANISM="Kryptoperidinium foliaceum, Strain CCMP 1326" /LENGTH=69 /DNA_ID=CAMNT_0017554383 /DNA_START=584 /DNA_END=794 /DNA_ORIENTATION=+